MAEENKKYLLKEALDELSNEASKKFIESLDISINLGIDSSKSDQNVRGASNLPHGNGKSFRVAVFAEGDEASQAKEAGADKVGMEDLADEIKSGNIDFDVVIATPDTMKVVSPLGQILGPKGLMPNPKSETVTKDIPNTVKNAKSGQIRYKSDNQGIIHARIGQIGYTEEQLKENFSVLQSAVMSAKPNSFKGKYLKSISISSTLGPGIKIGTE